MNDPGSGSQVLTSRAKRELLARLLEERARTKGKVPHQNEQAFEPFPLRDIQQAYWIGRNPDFELGGVGAHAYVEFDTPALDPLRASQALNTLIWRHGMLRAVVLPTGQQQVLADVPAFEVPVLDLSQAPPGTAAAELTALREMLSHRVFQPDHWPLFDLRLTRLPGQLTRIHFGIDLLIADLRSIYILLSEWFQLYIDPRTALPHLGISFRDYVRQEQAREGTEEFTRAKAYWESRLASLPPAPELVLARPPRPGEVPRFRRRTIRMPAEQWTRLRQRAEQHQVTPASLLLTAFARVLASWSRSPRFTIDVTIFNRLPLHRDVPHLVGDFTSIILVEADESGRQTFAERSTRFNAQLWDAIDHRQFSGVRVLREILRRDGEIGKAIMPVVFTCDLRHDMVSVKERSQDALPGEVVFGVSQTPQVYLDCQVFEEQGGLTINWDAVEAVFPAGQLQEMLDANERLLGALAEDDRAWLDPGSSLAPATQRGVVAHLNATSAPISTARLEELVAQQARTRPTDAAVVDGTHCLTYAALLGRAAHLAGQIRHAGAAPNSLVAVVMEKGWEQVVGVLGVLGAGAAYLPIEPTLPQERIEYLLANGDVRIVLTQPRVEARMRWPDGITRVTVDAPDVDGDMAVVPEWPASGRPNTDLAYVIYTSGSTGLPKGVSTDHRGAVNTILDINERFGIGPGDRVLALSSLSFDLSVYDIFGILAAGGTVVFPPAGAHPDPEAWLDVITRARVTVWNSVPAMMELLVDYAGGRPERAPASLRLVMMSGDWIPVTLPDRVKALVDGVAVVSLGGATEASIWSILFPIERTGKDWESVPYGRPMRNQRVYVLDSCFEDRPVGVPGELYIGGTGLAQGYWRDPMKTAARFVTSPVTGERLYRTGDWGAYFPDGTIRFLGREDAQVKVQGYRVELGEIEAALNLHPDVRAAVATAIGDPRGAKRLVAHVVFAGHGGSEQALKEFLADKLPAYMVPQQIVAMADLPLTANGKVDRAALPMPGTSRATPQPAGASAVSDRVQRLIARTLRVERVDMDAHLADLGANSLDMLRVGNALEEEFGVRPSMQEFFAFTNLQALVAYYERRLEELSVAGASATPAVRDEGWRAFPLIADPGARAAFKGRQPGLRQLEHAPIVALVDREEARGKERRTHRRFDTTPIPADAFGIWMRHLSQQSPEDPYRQYASAGGLYPVQVYLHVKDARVDGVAAGTYYYDPQAHRLAQLSDAARCGDGLHWPENQAIADAAAFTIFLVADVGAIAPLYQEHSLHLATIEAGLVAQVLDAAAPGCGVGLCQIGNMTFEPVRQLFRLEPRHVLVHTLVGGAVARGDAAATVADPTVRYQRPASVPGFPGSPALTAVTPAALEPEARLADDVRPSTVARPDARAAGVFVTGTTGFLGAFVLAELLKHTDTAVYCLVRASSDEDARLRLQRVLERYHLWDPARADRLVPVRGDLAAPRLGVSDEAWHSLGTGVEAVYHCGAMVNLVRPYEDLRASNVGGTHEILRLAGHGGAAVHLVSSVAVFPFNGSRTRLETDSLDHGEPLLGGYAQSKWVAERLGEIAAARGFPLTIYRPGTITGHSRTGIFSRDSYLSSFIRGCLDLGSVPDIDTPVDMVPVDYVAAAIVRLSQQPTSHGRVFHLTNPRAMSLTTLVQAMLLAGYRLRRVSYDAWKTELFALGTRLQGNDLFPFAAFLAQLATGPLLGPRYDCSQTLESLAGTPLRCPEAGPELLAVYFRYFVNSGFLPHPASPSADR